MLSQTCLDRYNQSGASDFEFECYSPFTDLAFVLEFPSAPLDWLSLIVPLFSFSVHFSVFEVGSFLAFTICDGLLLLTECRTTAFSGEGD